jgi:hypothetical protein
VNARRTLARAGAVLAAAALLVPIGHSSAAARASRSDTITMTVDSVSPAVPEPTQKHTTLTVTLTVTNTSTEALTGIRITGERGEPIATQSQLDAVLEDPAPPASPGIEIPSDPAVTVDLEPSGSANSSQTVSFVTSTSIANDGKGICMCANADLPALIYPLFFSAHTLVDGVDNRLGVVATYIPSFYSKPAPVRVSWVWPLLEPPHRLASNTEFLDDDLATSVSSGRLSRALSVVEAVRSTVPLTLLVDPELLDELEVMATEPYTVVTSGNKSVPGTGQAAAAGWLRRLSDVLQADPNIEVKLTPYADPDVQSVAQRGMTWAARLPTAMVRRVSAALAGRPLDTSLAWPATGAVSEQTLRSLYDEGVHTIVLNSTSVGTATPEGEITPGLTRFDIGDPNVVAALTSPAIEKYARNAIVADGAGAAALPPLLAEIAVRTAQEPDQEHALTITAPRYVDPDVGAAVAAIEQTSRSFFAEPISLGLAVSGSLVGTHYSHVLRVRAPAARPESPTLGAARDAAQMLPTIAALLDQRDDPRARAFVASLPAAIQRAKSSAWRDADFAAEATRFVNRLGTTVTGITDRVRILGPTSGSYTLASDNSPLPITVENDLPYEINVRVRLAADLDTPGFSATDIGTQHVERNQRHTFKIPTTVLRVGTIKIHAQLYAGATPLSLGAPVSMRVRSTAFGTVGVIITVVAGVALAGALLWRLFRRLRARRAQKPPAESVPLEPEPVP